MKIGSYNDLPSKINYQNEIMSLYVSTLLADEVGIRSVLSFDLMVYTCFDGLSDEAVVCRLLDYQKGSKETEILESLEIFRLRMPSIQRLIKQKHKDKNTLQLINQYRTGMSYFRKVLKMTLEARLKEFNLIELVDFEKEELWNLDFPTFTLDTDLEDSYIAELTLTLTEKDYTLYFDEVVEDLFSFCLSDAPDKNNIEFIKVPLFDFPLFEGFTYLQMKYSIQDLKTVLTAFKKSFDELCLRLYDMTFLPESLEEITQHCLQSIMPHKQPVQQAINNSIYLSRLKNKTDATKGIRFCLGITSIENLINYYDRCEIVQPYVATQIKQQVGRQMDLKAICIFVYCTF